MDIPNLSPHLSLVAPKDNHSLIHFKTLIFGNGGINE